MQQLETKSSRGLLDSDFANFGFIISNPAKFWYLCFYKSIYFGICVIQNSSKQISLCRNFEFSQTFSVKSQIFLHIYLITIMYEPWKLKEVTGNRILFRVILELCIIAVFRICCDYSWSIFAIYFICVYSLMCFLFHLRIKASQFVDLWETSRNIFLFYGVSIRANSNYCNKVTKKY